MLVTFLLITNTLIAQNGYFLSKSIHLNFKEIKQNDSLVNFEIYQNGIFIDKVFGNAKNSQNFEIDPITKNYVLNYVHTGIGSGSEKNYMVCPELMIILSFEKNIKTFDKKNDKIIYHKLIPIILAVSQKTEDIHIEVLEIDLNPLITDYSKVILIKKNNEYEIVNQTSLESPIAIKELIKIF